MNPGVAKHLSPTLKRIGIVTQPFIDNDDDSSDRCCILIEDLVKYLQERFSHAIITIHNGPKETTALAYARMIMANQTYGGISSFGIFPVVATFGQGYIRQQHIKRGPYKWIEQSPRIEQYFNNVHVVGVDDEDDDDKMMLKGGEIRGLWDSAGSATVLEWFRNESLVVQCGSKTCRMKVVVCALR